MTPIINILLPVYNRREVTKRFIECLSTQSYTHYRLLLIDDGSTDGTDKMVESRISNLVVIKGVGDWWWAGSLQKGIDWLEQHEVSDADVVMFANDDIMFESDFLQKAVDILNDLENVLLLPQVYDGQSDDVIESGIEADLQRMTFKKAESPEKINCLPTRGLLMRMTDMQKIGGFHPRLLPHYWSDYEFTIRANKKGLHLVTKANLTIKLDHEHTGFHGFDNVDFCSFVKRYFSKRSVQNPVYSSIFVLLTNSLLYIPLNLVKIWSKTILFTLKQLKRDISKRLMKVSIINAIRTSQSNLKIIIGSASTKQDGWISTNYPLLDLTNESTFSILFNKPESVSNFLAEHVWEHLSLDESAIACRNCFFFLKKGGRLRIAVPDGFHSDADYISQVKPGGYGPGAHDHKVLYNYQTLSAILKNTGFIVKQLEWFDENNCFHFEDWDVEDGMIMRSTRFDLRNKKNLTAYTSLIIDAIKP